MKKVFTYITLLSAGLLLVASCSKNEPPVFDDANAFVAFERSSVSQNEAGVKPSGEIYEWDEEHTLKVPVTLASLKGISETVKFEIVETTKDDKGNEVVLYHDLWDKKGDPDDKANWKDITAHRDVNFRLLTTSGTLSFDADHRTQYIEFELIYNPEYTGDLKFDIKLSKPESVNLGYASTCTVTIGDVNHPLTDLLGDYSAKDRDGTEWTMSLYKDEKDDHMVWFFNLFGNANWADFDTMFYGNVDAELTKINIPFGQTSEYKYSGETPVTLYWVMDDDSVDKTGSVDVAIIKDDNNKIIGLDFGKEYGFYALLEGLGYVGLVYPQITAEKN